MSDATHPFIRLRCPSCNKKLGFPPEASGRKAKCPACRHVFTVAAVSTEDQPSRWTGHQQAAAVEPQPASAAEAAARRLAGRDAVQVHCPFCDKRLMLPEAAVGRKARCSVCEEKFLVTDQPSVRASVPAAATGEPELEDTPASEGEGGDLYDLLEEAEQSGEATMLDSGVALSPATAGAAGGAAAPAAVRPVKLEYDHEVRDAMAGIFSRLGEAMGPLVKGCLLSLLGAIGGAILWTVIVLLTDVEIAFLTIGIGVLAGLGMQLGTRSESPLAGVIAACIALFGVVLGRIMVIAWFIAPAVAAFAALDSTDYEREQVIEYQTGQILKRQGIDPDEATEAQEDAARAQATQQVAAMSEEELQRQFEKYEKVWEAEYRRDMVIDYRADEILEGQGIDPYDATEAQQEAAYDQAREQVAAMSEAQVERQLEKYEQAEEEAFQARMAALEEDEDAGMPGGWLFLLGLFFFGIHGLLFTLLAVIAAYKVGASGLSFGSG